MKSHNAWALVRCGAAVAAIAGALAGPALANVSVRLDQNAIMDLRAPAGTVLIGDPAVVDVNLINPRRIAILGRGYGSTNVIITDRMGKIIFQQVVEVSRSSSGRVSVFRAGAVSNFTCTPACERTPAPGEENAAYQAYAAPYKEHSQAGQAAGGGGGGPPAASQ